MRALWKRLCATLLPLALLLAGHGSAFAGIADLDPALSGWLEQESILRFSMSMELQAHFPFTSEQTDMMNDILRHLSFLSSIESDGGDSLTTLALACDGDPLFTLTERETDGAFSLETSLLPNRTLESARLSVIDRLSGSQGQAEPLPGFDIMAAISEARDYYPALISACEPFAEKKKANYKIKDIGTAKWSQIARLTPEQSDEMLPLLHAVLQCGMDQAFRAELNDVRFDKNFIVGLYQLNENGGDIAVYMKGNLIYPDQSVGKFSYQWAFITKDDERTDTYKYELSRNTRPASSRVVSASLTQSLPGEQMKLKGNATLTTKANSVTTAQTRKIDLSGDTDGSARTLKGSVSDQVKVTQAGKTATTLTTLLPDLTLTGGNGGAILSGAVTMENQQEKAVVSAITFAFAKDVPADFAASTESQGLYAVDVDEGGSEPSGAPTSSISQNAEEDPAQDIGESGDTLPGDSSPDSDFLVNSPPIGIQAHALPGSPLSLSLDTASEDTLAKVMDELSQNLAATLLPALMGLPEEDLALIRSGMTAEDYASFLSLLSNP